MRGIHVTRNAHWTLRLGAAACFIGHGAFGIITKEAWVPYFGFAGISRDLAFTLMPVVGTIDIAAGMLVLLSPRPIVLAYMTVWALWTALLRPLTGDSIFETLERAGNYGVPLALLLLVGVPSRWRDWLRPSQVSSRAERGICSQTPLVMRVLLVSTALLLFGHGALAAQGKPILAFHLSVVGFPADALTLIGYAEMSAALLLLTFTSLSAGVWPSASLLIAIAAWKLATESLFPAAGAPIWELVERGGSFAAPIALALLLLRHPVHILTLKRTS
jgi:hypothetical protein